MIKREHIKQAIDAIASRDPEVGYVLDDMLGAGRIDIPTPDRAVTPHGDFIVLVENHPVTIKRFLFFNEGTVPIERGLLIKYGQMITKAALHERGLRLNFRDAARQTRHEGLKFLVRHEIDLVLARLTNRRAGDRKKGPQTPTEDGSRQTLAKFLEAIKDGQTEVGDIRALNEDRGPSVCYRSLLGNQVPVSFVPFPFTLNTLMQVADINLEFFHVRFLLKCLAQGLQSRIFTGMVGSSISGMLFLDFKQQLFRKQIEVVYVATVMGRGESAHAMEPPAVRGIGAVLMAGAWVLWKTRYPEYKEIFLDSEVGARDFYDRMGFHPRGMSEFVMGPPQPYLLKHIIQILSGVAPLTSNLKNEIKKLITRHIKTLAREKSRHVKDRQRRTLLDMVEACLETGGDHSFADTAIRGLQRYRDRIEETDALLRLARANHHEKIAKPLRRVEQVIPVVIDERYARHLQNLLHLENPKRISAFYQVLGSPPLTGRWTAISTRPATDDELSWIHTRNYISMIRQSAGRQLTSFDTDTQASEKTYDTAKLAVGGVFSLLDSIVQGRHNRGFACVRPPGHHAEPDKAMGFCIFNNVALGARYLREKYSAKRILIVDLDAHHGNGTQKAFYQTDEVMFISAHLFPGFPGTGTLGEVGSGRGEGYTVNVPMAAGSNDHDYARVLHFIVRPIALAYRPDMILVSLGFDLYVYDRLGGMVCTPEGYALLTSMLIEIAESSCGGRIAFVLEGGYSLKGIRECGLRVLQELCGVDTGIDATLDKVRYSNPDKLDVFKKVFQIQKKYWDIPY